MQPTRRGGSRERGAAPRQLTPRAERQRSPPPAGRRAWAYRSMPFTGVRREQPRQPGGVEPGGACLDAERRPVRRPSEVARVVDEAGVDGVDGDVHRDARDLGVGVQRAGAEPAGGRVAEAVAPPVEPHRLARAEQVHAADERVVRRFDEHVVVRPHQAVRVDLPAVPRDGAAVQVVLRVVVGLVLEEHEPAGAARVHVVEAGVGAFAGSSCHAGDGRPPRRADPARRSAQLPHSPCPSRDPRAFRARNVLGSDPITRSSGVRPRSLERLLGLLARRCDRTSGSAASLPSFSCPTTPHPFRNPRILRPPSRS